MATIGPGPQRLFLAGFLAHTLTLPGPHLRSGASQALLLSSNPLLVTGGAHLARPISPDPDTVGQAASGPAALCARATVVGSRGASLGQHRRQADANGGGNGLRVMRNTRCSSMECLTTAVQGNPTHWTLAQLLNPTMPTSALPLHI